MPTIDRALVPYWQTLDGSVKLYHGDVLQVLKRLPSRKVHCCITSPPYWGLRDYGTATWEGGDEECDHKPNVNLRETRPKGKLVGSTRTVDEGTVQRDCHCGARRIDSQLGLEKTPQEYVAKMVQVFREVRRVLRDDGTCWVNMGDGYATSSVVRTRKQSGEANRPCAEATNLPGKTIPPGLKPKDLVGIPWMLAFALRDDGWYLRSDIIWHKPNPMPESVTDRPTKSHEYLFLMSKKERYYYDAEAIAEPAAYAGQMRGGSTNRYEQNQAGMDNKIYDTRNKRSVWTILTKPYPEAHFATFPKKLVEPCILAGCPMGGVVLDPFMGSGTVATAALEHGRECLGIELNKKYLDINAIPRVKGTLFSLGNSHLSDRTVVKKVGISMSLRSS